MKLLLILLYLLVKNLVLTGLFDVVGLEARDRVGGRVYTDNGDEIGAAWIHGTDLEHEDGTIESNPIMDLALSIVPEKDLHKTMEFFAVHSDGTELDSDGSIWDDMWTVLNKIKTSPECIENAYKTTELSIYDFINANWEMLFEHLQGHNEKAVVKSVIEWQSYYATLWENTSIGSMAVDKEFEGDQLLILNGGYNRILNHYTETIGLKNHIHLNTPVTHIQKNEDGCRVFTKTGEVFDADIVVVTVPLGVLKNKGITFEPPLPEEKQKSIDRLGFGVYDKIFVTFKEPIEAEAKPSRKGFWCSNADVISVVPKSDDDYNQFLLSTKIQSLKPQDITEATAQERRPYDERDHDHIGIEMANLSKISADPKIVMLIYGSSAMRMEAVADDPEALREFALSKLRNAFPDREIPEIINVKATKWGSDIYSYGSFANIPVGASGQDMVNLSEPVDNKILFAGEATFPLHYSTVHGAFKSGRREFERIMELYNGLLEH